MAMDRRTLILTVAGAMATAGSAFGQAAPDVPIEALVQDEPDMSFAVEDDAHDHLNAQVLVNGRGPFPFLIDTGANMSCVSARLAQTLALPPGKPVRVYTALGTRFQPTVRLDQLQVGARNRRAVTAPALPLWSGGQMGVLGVDWLAKQRLALNFKASTVDISKSQADKSAEGQIVVRARRRLGQLTIVDADLGDTPISAMLDSGAQITACNDALRDLLKARTRLFSKPEIIGLESLTGEKFAAEMVYLPFLRLGGVQLGNVPVAHANMHAFKLWDLEDRPALLLGMDLLRQFSCVTLDFGRSTVRFDI